VERTLSCSDFNEFIDVKRGERVSTVPPAKISLIGQKKGLFQEKIPVLMVHSYVAPHCFRVGSAKVNSELRTSSVPGTVTYHVTKI
jgi:hypothetical protein